MNGTTIVREGGTPTTTIVTTFYNQGRFIRATIECLPSQDYPHFECIIMERWIHRPTAALAAEYGSQLRWISETDRGEFRTIFLLPGAISRAIMAFNKARSGVAESTAKAIDPNSSCNRPPSSTRLSRRSADWTRGFYYATDWDLLIRLGKRFGLHYGPD
jgi:hypothetical protein